MLYLYQSAPRSDIQIAVVTDLIVGRYEILEDLGERKKAIDRLTGREVMVRSKPAEAPPAEDLLERLARLRHANLASCLHHFPMDGEVLIVSESVDGQPLEDILSESKPVDLVKARAWIAGMAKGAHAAHEAGLLVGKLTPAKIVIANDGAVKLLDAGFSGAAADAASIQNEAATLAAIYRRMLGDNANADPAIQKMEAALNCSDIVTALEEQKAPAPAAPESTVDLKVLPKSKLRFPFPKKWDRRHVFAIIATLIGIFLGFKFATHGQSQGLLSRWTGS
jgi:serine/threonine protein kinase